MSVGHRLGAFWLSVRPRTPRGVRLAVAGVLGGAAVMSVALVAGAAMAWSPYLDFSLHRDVDARSWAALDPSFTSSSTCARCHQPEAQRLSSASHAAIGCQSCHGPLLAHVEAGDAADSQTVSVAVPTDDVCVRCHVQVDGRPAGQQEIVPAQHYVSACLECHDPHTAIANRPPEVRHPLDDLPPCLTCHGPEGFKARNQRHPVVAGDEACLDCHAPGRGPEDDQVSP
jgi:Cytochrome c554 and c-prime